MMNQYKSKPSGFTLLELVVVMAILAVIATIAVQSLDSRIDQNRYEATQAGLQNIQEAVIGPANQHSPDGTRFASGFVADVGRLPKATSVMVNSVAQLQPLELWENPYGLEGFQNRNATAANITSSSTDFSPALDADLEVYVPSGWRGPYLRLNAGQTTRTDTGVSVLTDGWGNPFDLLQSNRTTVTNTGAATDQIAILRSRGFDGIQNNAYTNNYGEDLYANFVTLGFAGGTTLPDYPAVTSSDNVHASKLTVNISSTGVLPFTTTEMVVKYFGPDPATGKIKVISKKIAIPTSTTSLVVEFDDDAITIGPRILRVYNGTVNGGVVTGTVKSKVIRMILAPGGNQQDVQF